MIATPCNPYFVGGDTDPAFLAAQLLMLQEVRAWVLGQREGLPVGAAWWLRAVVQRREESAREPMAYNYQEYDPNYIWQEDELGALAWLLDQVEQVQPLPADGEIAVIAGRVRPVTL